VATDIAARGIDVSRISHVINYDMPDTVDAYTHRIGRTGRAAMTGDAYTFVTSEDRAFLWTIERALGEKIEKRIVDDFDYAVPPESTETRCQRHPRRGRSATNSRSRVPVAAESYSSSHERPAAGTGRVRRDLSTSPFVLGHSKPKSHR